MRELVTRESRIHELDPLFNSMRTLADGQKLIDQKLADHMRNEEGAIKKIASEVTKMSEQLNLIMERMEALYSSMPRDRHDNIDSFGHKLSHIYIDKKMKTDAELQQEERQDAREIKRSLREAFIKSASQILIIATCFVLLGKEAIPVLMKFFAG